MLRHLGDDFTCSDVLQFNSRLAASHRRRAAIATGEGTSRRNSARNAGQAAYSHIKEEKNRGKAGWVPEATGKIGFL